MSSKTLKNLLFQDLVQLSDANNSYDVIIQVGKEPNVENVKAHSIILKNRSTYFNVALSSRWVKKEGNIIIFKKPNIKPNIFRIILKYLYTGIVDLDMESGSKLIELLVATDEFNIDGLMD